MGAAREFFQGIGKIIGKEEQPAASDAVFEVVPVNPDDILKRGQWKNNAGKRIRIETGDSMYYTEYPGGEKMLTDAEAVQKVLEVGGYIFVPALSEGTTHIGGVAPQRVEVMVDQPTPLEGEEDQNIAIEQCDEEMLETFAEIDRELLVVEDAIARAQQMINEGNEAMQPIIDELRGRLTDATDKKKSLAIADDIASEGEVLDAGYLVGKEKRLKDLQEVQAEIAAIVVLAEKTMESLKKLEIQASGHNDGAAESSSGNGDSKDTKGKGRKRKGGSDGDGTDDEEDEAERQVGKRTGRDVKNRREAKRDGEPMGEVISDTTDSLGNLAALLRPKEEGVPFSDSPKELVPSAQTGARESATQGNERQVLEMFLERPEGREVIDTYRKIIQGEWQKFHDAFMKTEKQLSWNKKLQFWKEHFLPQVMGKLERDLIEKRGVQEGQDYSILSALMDDLEEEFVERQERKRSKRREE